jgi:hypothetical protein
MNGQRDIERTLEVWLLDGSSTMPDRLFDAVFDQVERVPQRRVAHLQLRFTEMNPRIRLFTVLAAALLVVVAAIAVIGGGSKGLTSATPSPTATPSLAATESGGPVPAALDATWIGPPGGLTGLDPDAGMTVLFSNGNFWMTQSNLGNDLRLHARAVTLGDDRLMLTARGDDSDCADGDIGIYTWTLSPSGQLLRLTAVSDECAPRLAALPGPWELVDCPESDDNCLGALDAGRHSSHFFDPFLGTGQSWTPRYAVLSYATPDGWANVADWPNDYRLAPDPAPGETAIYFNSDVVVVSEEDPCQEVPATGVGETAEEIATWLSTAPGVTATTPVHSNVGGLDAWRVDMSMNPAWTATCEFSEGKPTRPLFTDRGAGPGYHWGLNEATRMRAYLVDLGDGRAMLIDVETDMPDEYYTAYIEAATGIVDSLQITP